MQHYEIIRSLREDSDTNQATIAELLGVQQSYYSKQERGAKPFQIEQIIKICQYYGVSADYILDLGKGMKHPR